MDDDEHWLDKAQREHEERLTVGQRVRVDLGECPHYVTWHGNIEQGAVGKIMGLDIDAAQKPDGHRYWVWFDWPLRMRRSWSYAAHELTPIPDRTPEEIVQETLARIVD